jgi:glutamate-5-semialdehyde dehydrogenase
MTDPSAQTAEDPSREAVHAAARRARSAAATLAVIARAGKDRALHAMADRLLEDAPAVLAANVADVQASRDDGHGEHLIDRLQLDSTRIAAMAEGMRHVAGLPDPVGEVVRGSTLPNGLELRQVRVPFGVVGMIYEGRPNVTADAAALCLKAGNAVLLRGSRSAARSNAAIVESLRAGLVAAELPPDAVQVLGADDRSTATALMRARGLVDLVIPRGGAGLIRTVVEQSTVPVIETGVGNCHVYVDASADPVIAEAVVVNSKTSRVSVCNSAETLLVHRDVPFVPRLLAALVDAGVTLHGDDAARAAHGAVVPATEEDWASEYLSMDMAVRVVDDLPAALDHIARWSTGHSEAIVADSAGAIAEFTAGVDAAAVLVNASTRFTDGAEFGFGAEIGISTQKLHARGPLGLPELTSTTYVVTGAGHTR